MFIGQLGYLKVHVYCYWLISWFGGQSAFVLANLLLLRLLCISIGQFAALEVRFYFYWPIWCFGGPSAFLLATNLLWRSVSIYIGQFVTIKVILHSYWPFYFVEARVHSYWPICCYGGHAPFLLDKVLFWRTFCILIGKFDVMVLILHYYWLTWCFGG